MWSGRVAWATGPPRPAGFGRGRAQATALHAPSDARPHLDVPRAEMTQAPPPRRGPRLQPRSAEPDVHPLPGEGGFPVVKLLKTPISAK